MLIHPLKSPEYSLLDVATFLDEGLGRRWPTLSREVYAFNTSKFNCNYSMPMFLMLGRHDWQTPSTVAAEWLETIQAPVKQVFWFENSAHSPMIDEPELFAQTLIEKIRPLAFNTSKSPINK
jgi:proline iminopeptidase